MDKLVYDSGFGILPKRVMQDTNLSIQAKGIFAYLVTYAGAGNTAFPSRSLITYHLGISKDTFTKYLKELKDNGYIEVTKSDREQGKFSHNIYTLISYPQYPQYPQSPCPKIPDTVTPDTVTPDTVNSDTNNNSIKNNNNKNNSINVCISENLSSMSKLYQENIGMANGIVGEWLIEIADKIEVPLFKRALEICAEKGNNNLGYLKGIIKKWLDKNITTLEQLKAYELQNKKHSNKSIPQTKKFIPTKYKTGAGAIDNHIMDNFNTPEDLEAYLLAMQKEKGM